MSCVHLQQLYELCDREGLLLSSSDLIHIVCPQCGKQDVCPSKLSEHIDEADVSNTPATETGPEK